MRLCQGSIFQQFGVPAAPGNTLLDFLLQFLCSAFAAPGSLLFSLLLLGNSKREAVPLPPGHYPRPEEVWHTGRAPRLEGTFELGFVRAPSLIYSALKEQ